MADLNINKILESTNLAEDLSEEELARIGSQVLREFEIDAQSRKDWMDQTEQWIKLATQVVETKSWPWPDSANVKFPLVTTAAMQFAARAYPALIPGLDVVRMRVVGNDADGQKAARAFRIEKHMSYQILEEMDTWEEDMDKLCMIVPIVGCAFKKTWHDSVSGHNRSELVHAKDLVVNYYATSLETASRKTHVLFRTKNQIKERISAGAYLDVELPEPLSNNPQNSAAMDAVQKSSPPSVDSNAPYVLLEQHRFWDLDGDGYEEPYIITIEQQSGKVLRIVARFDVESVQKQGDKIIMIEPIEYFTMFPFIPNPDGGFYPLGFGALLGPLNETVNTLLNQLIDSGTLSNLQAGFLSKGIRLKGGAVQFKPGEWKVVQTSGDDLRKGIFPMPTREPSNVLFQLLGTMVQSGKELASVAEIFVGKMPGQNTPATTTMATIEQGMKVFTAIYKRLFRGLKKEYQKLFRLNRIYLGPKEEFLILDTGQEGEVSQDDYKGDITDVRPAADPQAVSEIQKLAKAQGLIELLQLGTIDKMEVTKRVLEAQGQEDIQKLINTQPPPPDPKQQEMQGKMQMEQQKAQMSMQQDQQKFQLEMALKQMEMQLKQQELKMKEQEMKLKLQAQQMQMVLDQQKMSMDAEHMSRQHEMKMQQAEDQHLMKTQQAKEKKE
jgi:hypothetical protein